MASPDALLLLSGGIDSVQALHARCVAGESTRTHFVELKNWEGRSQYEANAVTSVLAWFRRAGFSHLIHHSQSSFDYGDLRYVVRDHNIWGLKAGIILANPRNDGIKKVVRTFHRDSVVGGLDSSAGQAAERGWREPIERLTAGRDVPVEFVYPQQFMTKGDIMSALPADLLGLTWYCRKPRRNRVCHKCHTCKQVDAVKAGKPLPPLDTRGVAARPIEPVEPAGNASRGEWATYAASLGFEVDGLKRNEIRDLVAAGK